MFCSFQIEPTAPGDLTELAGFLRAGFHASGDAPHFSDAVLRWKYFEPCGVQFGPRSYVARSGGEIVGHAGIVPRVLAFPSGEAANPQSALAIHFIDLLASPAHPTAGLMLMKNAFQTTEVQYALGGSAQGQRIARLTGYDGPIEFPVMSAILRPLYRLRSGDHGLAGRSLRAARDLGYYLTRPRQEPPQAVSICRVISFDSEVDRLFESRTFFAVSTKRSADLLNTYLRFPGGKMTGWMILADHEAVGYALLNVKARDNLCFGKIVDCFLPNAEVDLWHAAVAALKRELGAQRADVVSCYATAPWIVEACRRSGFRPTRSSNLRVRDVNKRMPDGAGYYLTMLEGDHGYF